MHSTVVVPCRSISRDQPAQVGAQGRRRTRRGWRPRWCGCRRPSTACRSSARRTPAPGRRRTPGARGCPRSRGSRRGRRGPRARRRSGAWTAGPVQAIRPSATTRAASARVPGSALGSAAGPAWGSAWTVSSAMPVTEGGGHLKIAPIVVAKLPRHVRDQRVPMIAHRDHPPADHDMPDVGRGGREDHRFRGGAGWLRPAGRVQADGGEVGERSDLEAAAGASRGARGRRRLRRAAVRRPASARGVRCAAARPVPPRVLPRTGRSRRGCPSPGSSGSRPRTASRRADAVGQVAFGRRAHADAVAEVPSMSMSICDRCVACTAVVRGPSAPCASSNCGGGPVVPGQAGVVLGALLGQVDVQRRSRSPPPRPPPARAGPPAPRAPSGSPRRRTVSVARVCLAQCLDPVGPASGVAVGEALLASFSSVSMPPAR